jgi:predicted aspartyl protease
MTVACASILLLIIAHETLQLCARGCCIVVVAICDSRRVDIELKSRRFRVTVDLVIVGVIARNLALGSLCIHGIRLKRMRQQRYASRPIGSDVTRTRRILLFTSTTTRMTTAVLMMNTNFEVVDIKEFDILLTDIKGETIRRIEIDGAKHLSEVVTSDSHSSVLNGVTFGDYSRVLVKAVLTAKGKSLNAIMLVDTGSPYTFLTSETFKALQVNLEDQPEDQAFVLVNGQRTKAHLSKAHFEDVNVLGTNFLEFCEVTINYPKRKALITIVPV